MEKMNSNTTIFKIIIVAPFLLFVIFSFNSTDEGYEPVMMTRGQMEAAIKIEPAKEIEKPGKLWVYHNFVFVIEQYRGIHVIDNSDPESPVPISFIHIDGCTDVAVKNGLIYANNAVDLVAQGFCFQIQWRQHKESFNISVHFL